MFEPRFFPVAAISIGDVNANERDDDLVQFRRFHQNAEVARERFVSSRAAECDAEENFVADLHHLCADVICVLDRADESAAVEGDVELARQIVERAVVDDDLR